jgi:NAD(P)-dependent dehydrogenase (short-subunit alcohol dehydrogenase family)
MMLKGKTAIVTRGARGVAKGIATAFVKAGASVLISASVQDARLCHQFWQRRRLRCVAHARSGYITGQTLMVDGGQTKAF